MLIYCIKLDHALYSMNYGSNNLSPIFALVKGRERNRGGVGVEEREGERGGE